MSILELPHSIPAPCGPPCLAKTHLVHESGRLDAMNELTLPWLLSPCPCVPLGPSWRQLLQMPEVGWRPGGRRRDTFQTSISAPDMRGRGTFLGFRLMWEKGPRGIRYMIGKAEAMWQSWSKEERVEGTTWSSSRGPSSRAVMLLLECVYSGGVSPQSLLGFRKEILPGLSIDSSG